MVKDPPPSWHELALNLVPARKVSNELFQEQIVFWPMEMFAFLYLRKVSDMFQEMFQMRPVR